MSEFCSSHPTQPAWWRCPSCKKALCPRCIVQRKGGTLGNQSFYFCPRCNVAVEQLDAANIIDPFWKRLHKFFAYPFSSMESIGLILGCALLSTMLFGLLSFIPWAIMVKYAYESLRYTSEGKFSPPKLSSDVLSENFAIVGKQILLFAALLFFFGMIVSQKSLILVILYGICALLCLPAMIIILAINDNLLQALNPVYFIGMATRLGWSYLLMFFFLFLLYSAPSALGYAVIQHLPEILRNFLWTAAENYYTLVSYHMMGYVILQYHDRLNYAVDMDTLLASRYPMGLPVSVPGSGNNREKGVSGSPEESALLDELAPLIQEGKLDDAIALIKERTHLRIKDRELSERYVNLLKMRHRDQELLAYASNHLDLLVKSGDKAKSTSFYDACMKIERNFKASSTSLFKVGSWFNELGEAKRAIQALNHLSKIHPKDALIPKAYFRAAQILNEKLANPARAKKILTTLMAKYPDHEISNFAGAYLKGIAEK